MKTDNQDYRKKVYGALKGELKDSFTKTEEEFYKSLDEQEGYSEKVYEALKGELQDKFTKTPEEFSSLMALKKKEETFSEGYSELGKQLGSRFSQTGSSIDQTKEQEDSQKRADYIQSKSKELGEKYPDFFAKEGSKELYQSKLEEKGFNVIESEKAASTSQKTGENQLIKDNTNKAKSYLKYTSGYGEDASINLIANATDSELETFETEMLKKGISQDGINNAIADYKNQYLNRKGEEIGRSYDSSIEATAEDRVKQRSEDGKYTRQDILKEKDEMLISRLRSRLPESEQIKASVERKSQQLISELKEKMSKEELTDKERDTYEAKLEVLEKYRLENSDMPQRLFNPVTGKFQDRRDASQEARQYEDAVLSIGNQLTDKDKTLKNAKKALHRFEAMDELYNTEVSFRKSDGTGNMVLTYKEALENYKPIIEVALAEDLVKLRERAEKIKSNWVRSKAQFDAINKAYLTNTDPKQADKGFFSAAGEALAKETGFEEAKIGTDRSFINEYVSLMDDLGQYTTPEQREQSKASLSEKVGEAVGTSLPIMAEIVASTALTEGLGSAVGLGTKLKPIKDLFTKKWGKAGKFIYNTFEEGIKGGAAFAPTSETFAGGFGEGITQGIIEGVMGKKGKTLNRFLKYGFKAGGGGVGETIQEYGGQLATELNREGINVNQAFENTFGRNIEDATDKLMVTLITSTMMSGAFNAKVLVESRAKLQSDYDEGKIPEDKMADAKELLEKTAPDEIEAKKEIAKVTEQPSEEITITKTDTI